MQSDATKGKVVLTSLSKPAFSPLARQANVEGEVIVEVIVRQDGSTKATVVKGHPMLKQGALDSAMQSRFECRVCSAPLSYRLVYTFKRTSEGSCCDGMGAPVKVEEEPQSYDERGHPQTRVTISAEKICLCDPSFKVTKKVRSLKCLYLWKCSTREQVLIAVATNYRVPSPQTRTGADWRIQPEAIEVGCFSVTKNTQFSMDFSKGSRAARVPLPGPERKACSRQFRR
jgi:Gram-negative bacterial TonB protein C-terminal